MWTSSTRRKEASGSIVDEEDEEDEEEEVEEGEKDGSIE